VASEQALLAVTRCKDGGFQRCETRIDPKFELAPGISHLSPSGENQFVFRTGFLWDFPVGKMTLTPAVFYDFTEGQDFFNLGLGFGTGF
jgi:hypothetical protein